MKYHKTFFFSRTGWSPTFPSCFTAQESKQCIKITVALRNNALYNRRLHNIALNKLFMVLRVVHYDEFQEVQKWSEKKIVINLKCLTVMFSLIELKMVEFVVCKRAWSSFFFFLISCDLAYIASHLTCLHEQHGNTECGIDRKLICSIGMRTKHTTVICQHWDSWCR